METDVFRAFVKHALAIETADEDTPPSHSIVRAAVMRKLGMAKTATAPWVVPTLETAGLGILAIPSVRDLRHSRDPRERSHAKWELAGLGTLAAHPVYELAQVARGKLRPRPSLLRRVATRVVKRFK